MMKSLLVLFLVLGISLAFPTEGKSKQLTESDDGGKSYVQWSPDLTNRSGPSQLFVKPGYSIKIRIFYEVKNSFEAKTNSLNLDGSLKPNSLNPHAT